MFAVRRHSALWALLATLSLSVPALHADTFSVLAFDNATVRPAGPRPGSFGKDFFNAEGSNNLPNFASFAVADFNSSALANAGNLIPSPPTNLNAISIALTQANASFTQGGSINFYLVEDTTTTIQPNDGPLAFDASDPAGEGLSGQLGPVHFLGSGTFTPSDNGTTDTFTFPSDPSTPLDSGTVTYVLAVLSTMNADGTTGGPLRVVITPADPNVAATYAGFSSTTYQGVTVVGPTITLDVSFN